MFKILRLYRDNEDPSMGEIDGKAFEVLSKAECLDIIRGHGIDGLELCRSGNIDPIPECLCKLAFFTGQVCPKSGGSNEEPPKKKKKVETPTVSSICYNVTFCRY